MTDPVPYRFYGELASWWPLISPVEDYAGEAAYLGGLLASAVLPVRDVLELGSGGGHNAAHLIPRFSMTLVDLSSAMLDMSRALNPSAGHEVGDMRSVRLGRQFDAVLVHDAVDYMTTEEDLALAIGTAHAHCRPGGVAVFMPDATAEKFEPGADVDGNDGPDGRAVRFLEWTHDPDPSDTEVLTEYSFLLRDADGRVTAVHETHRHGVFPRATWLRLLAGAGFDVTLVEEETTEDHPPRDVFVAHRPL